jgi:hypothetical protein
MVLVKKPPLPYKLSKKKTMNNGASTEECNNIKNRAGILRCPVARCAAVDYA